MNGNTLFYIFVYDDDGNGGAGIAWFKVKKLENEKIGCRNHMLNIEKDTPSKENTRLLQDN